MPDYIGDEAEGELRRVYRTVPRYVFYVAAYDPHARKPRRLKPKKRHVKGFDKGLAQFDLVRAYHRRGLFVRYVERYGVER